MELLKLFSDFEIFVKVAPIIQIQNICVIKSVNIKHKALILKH